MIIHALNFIHFLAVYKFLGKYYPMIGERFLAPIDSVDYVEGLVTHYNEDSGFVTLITDEGECFKGYEYQLESLDEY